MQSDFSRRLPGFGNRRDGQSQSRDFWQRLHLDWPLLLLAYLMLVMGTVVLYSASEQGSHLYRQLVFAGIGTVIMVVVAQIPPAVMQRWSYLAYLAGLVSLVLVLVIGNDAKGAQRWIDLGFISFQPSEAIKLGLPLAVAAFLANRVLPPKFLHILIALGLIVVPVALVLLQPDLGTGLLVAACGFTVLFLAGLRWRYLIGGFLLMLVSLPAVWAFVLHDYQKQRVLTMFNPEADKLGAGWNIIQSTTAIGSGGWSGKGWMAGTQSHLDFLPESHTDFIIAVLAEEFGFRGVLVLLAGYCLLLVRGYWISYNAKTTYSRLVAGAITTMIFVYVFVNMGMVSGILPVVGVPLPLLSYGGTSLLSMFAAFGILMAIATEREHLHSR